MISKKYIINIVENKKNLILPFVLVIKSLNQKKFLIFSFYFFLKKNYSICVIFEDKTCLES